jgi:hypothetical protein
MDPPKINYVDPKSIMVINPTGKIRQLFVPFKVQVLEDTDILKKNSWVLVEEVQPHKEYKMLYRITKYWWPFDLFKIAATF